MDSDEIEHCVLTTNGVTVWTGGIYKYEFLVSCKYTALRVVDATENSFNTCWEFGGKSRHFLYEIACHPLLLRSLVFLLPALHVIERRAKDDH
jgi:hypothetical protein